MIYLLPPIYNKGLATSVPLWGPGKDNCESLRHPLLAADHISRAQKDESLFYFSINCINFHLSMN